MKITVATALLLSIATAASAQIKPKKIIEQKTTNKVNQVISRTVEQVLDTILVTQSPSPKDTLVATKMPAKDTIIKPVFQDQPFQSYTQYDFVPGDTVLFFEDFSQDSIGDFPSKWTTNKSGEVNTVSVAPGRWLNLNATEGNWWYLKELKFPKNFILEFDIIPKKGAPRYAVGVTIYGEDKFVEMSDPNSCKTGLIVNIAKTAWDAYGLKAGSPRVSGNSTLNLVKEEKLNHVIIWVQNRRVRIYHAGAKVLDMPTVLYEDSRFNRLGFALYRGASSGSFISNIRITTASPDNRSKLLTEGKVVSYGINFDVNKANLKPESYGALKSIATVLDENPSLRVRIVGHTDADGSDAFNLELSRQRAISVKNELVNTFQVEASRLETDGKGESQPVAPNTTPANKALNRRVEFIKL